MIGSVARYRDLHLSNGLAPSEAHPDAAMLAAVRRALPGAMLRPIAATARVGGGVGGGEEGSEGCDVEAMEGFAVLRAISNDVEESDRAR